MESLTVIDATGAVVWHQGGYAGNGSAVTWFLNDVIVQVPILSDTNTPIGFQGLLPENGQLAWKLAVNRGRWDWRNSPVICAGIAYGSIEERSQNGGWYLLAVDLANQQAHGALGVTLSPLFVADGIMLARDSDTDEIVAIGTVPPVLRAGGRAKVTKDATLRGAPSDTAIERAKVKADTVVEVTGDIETAKGVDWIPVTVPDTKATGWLPADVLAGLDGAISFAEIELSRFGEFTAYPKFTSGTKAVIAEKVDLRGAPNDSAAKKSTLDAGTAVTVTSPPTKTGDVEWAPIKVDATSDSGWVPTSSLKLASPA
jgi:hypothetical protein